MNTSVYDYYHTSKIEGIKDPFHEVILLHKKPEFSADEIFEMAPTLPQGWYEISLLKRQDRIEFVRDYWLSTMPFKPVFHKFINEFFSRLEDLGVFLIRDQKDESYKVEMVYSLNDEMTFFRGKPPLNQDQCDDFTEEFDYQIPSDFLRFLQIHDGFSKNYDSGIFTSYQIPMTTQVFQKYLIERNHSVLSGQQVVDSNDLIPFYRSYELNDFQCFFAEWTPYGEAGNVCFFDSDFNISDFQDVRNAEEKLAFPAFSDWLIFYLDELHQE